MPKLQIEAQEITDPNVNIVAMVKRGANRIPFRLTKKDENDMIDLSKLGRTFFAKKDPEFRTLAVMFAKSVDESTQKAVNKSLLKYDVLEEGEFKKTEGDGLIMLAKSDVKELPADTTFVLKFNEDVAIAFEAPVEFVKSLSTYDYESTQFAEVMSKGAFAPSVCMAQEMLQRTFFNIMEKAEEPSELAKMMKTAVDEFSTYVTTLAKGLPKSVFKADAEITKAWPPKEKDKEEEKGKKKDVKKEEISANPVADPNASDRPHGQGGGKTNLGVIPAANNDVEGNNVERKGTGEIPTVSMHKNEGDAESLDVNGEKRKLNVDPKVSGAGGAQSAPEAEQILKGLSETIFAQIKEGLADIDKKMGEQIATIKGDVDKAMASVKKTEKTMETVVLGDTAEGDKTGLMHKSDGNGSIAPIDTAFMKVEDDLPLDRTKPVRFAGRMN